MLHCVFAEDFSILYEVKLFILRSNLALNRESVFCELRKPNRLTFNRAYIKSKYLKYCWELNVKKIMFDTEKVRSLTCMDKKIK